MTEHVGFYRAKALLGLPGSNWPETLLAKQIAVLQHPFESKLLEASMTADQRIFADMLNEAAREGEIEFSKVWNTTSPPELYGDEFTQFLNTLTEEEPAEYRGVKVVLWDRYPNGLPWNWSMPRFRHIEIEDTDFPDLDDDDAIENAFNDIEMKPFIVKANAPFPNSNERVIFESAEHVPFATSPRFSRTELANWLKFKKFKPSDLLTDWLNHDKAVKPIRRLIEKSRDTTELLALVYEYFEFCGLKVGDEKGKHSATLAWGDLLAKKFTSDLILSIQGERKATILILNGVNEIDLSTFSRTYNRRFQ